MQKDQSLLILASIYLPNYEACNFYSYTDSRETFTCALEGSFFCGLAMVACLMWYLVI